MDAIFPDEKGMAWPPLIFLLLTYGYILFRASGFISDGAELLLLVLSPGLVGGLLLPLLGSLPDGLIVLFSGIGPDAQQQLSVGVGTLAGSTILLLTLPWAACAVMGRVDLSADGSSAQYKRGLTAAGSASWHAFLTRTGIQTSNVVNPAAYIMLGTSLTYLVVQGPAWAQRQYPSVDAATPDQVATVAKAVRNFALAGFVLALLLFIAYSVYSVRSSMQEEAQANLIREARKQAVVKGLVGLAQLIGLENSVAREEEDALRGRASGAGGFGLDAMLSSLTSSGAAGALVTNTGMVKALFDKYDADNSGALDVAEVRAMLAELKLPLPSSYVKELVREVGGPEHQVRLEEFKQLLDTCMEKVSHDRDAEDAAPAEVAPLRAQPGGAAASASDALLADGEEEEEEEEEEAEEEEAANLTPAEIRRKAFGTLALGVALVSLFSDPMVNVLSEIANKADIPPFYVGFVIAPVISNASEIISSISQAQKKRKANIDVTYSQLLGAATMNVRQQLVLRLARAPASRTPAPPPHPPAPDAPPSPPPPPPRLPPQNTFCLCIFLLIVYLKGLYWEYSAEVLAILVVEALVAGLVLTQKNNTMPVWKALLAGLLFPAALVFVYLLENVAGFN
jgi:Ca2+/Na+ antiporter